MTEAPIIVMQSIQKQLLVCRAERLFSTIVSEIKYSNRQNNVACKNKWTPEWTRTQVSSLQVHGMEEEKKIT